MPAASAVAVCLMGAAGSRRTRRALAPHPIPVRARARSPARILAQVPVPTLLRGRDPVRDPIRLGLGLVLVLVLVLDPVLVPVLVPGRILRGHRRLRLPTGTTRSGTPPPSPPASRSPRR